MEVEAAVPGRYVLTWAAQNGRGPVTARTVVDRLRVTNGDLHGHVRVRIEAADGVYELHQGRLNLHAVRSRRELARTLQERFALSEPTWDQLIEELCDEVARREHEPTPVEELEPADPGPVEWAIEPLVLDRTVTLLYAPGGSGKTYVALWLALLAENGVAFRGHQVAPRRVLYLDWESDSRETRRRLWRLSEVLRRHGLRRVRWPLYRRCVLPLSDEVAEIAGAVAEHDVGLVVVDSAGVACGGDIYGAEAALEFFRGLRRICSATSPPAAALVLHHVTKSERREEHGARLPLGSVYFENMPRLTWEVRPEEQDDGAGSLVVGLRCRKSNVGRQQPLGVQLDFNDGEVDVRLVDAPADRTPKALTSEAILEALAEGPAKVAELVEATGCDSNAVRSALRRLKAAGRVTNLSHGVWSLAAEEQCHG
jgi:hypothetical protein